MLILITPFQKKQRFTYDLIYPVHILLELILILVLRLNLLMFLNNNLIILN